MKVGMRVNSLVKRVLTQDGLTRSFITGRIDAAMVLAPFPDSDSVHEFILVGVVDFPGKIVNELFIALLKHRIVRIWCPSGE